MKAPVGLELHTRNSNCPQYLQSRSSKSSKRLARKQAMTMKYKGCNDKDEQEGVWDPKKGLWGKRRGWELDRKMLPSTAPN